MTDKANPMSKNQPFTFICSDCGRTANDMTCIRRYGSRAKQASFRISTMHQAVCDICGETKDVTELRDFFYPSERAMLYLKNYLTQGKS
jgi:hypothetical protein